LIKTDTVEVANYNQGKMATKEDPATVAGMVSAMNEHSDGTNVMKESIKTFSDPDGSDKRGDVYADSTENALVQLKDTIEKTKTAIKKEKKKAKWNFRSSPHQQFNKTLDDLFMAFIVWAKSKNNGKYNVSKAFRRLESYAEWMEESAEDLIEPPLSAESVRAALDALGMNVSIDKDGFFVWWFDLNALDKEALKKDIVPEVSLRAFVWYAHFIMYNKAAQEKGMVIVENCEKMGFFEMLNLFPMKLGAKLDRLTIGVLPIKTNKIYIIEAPKWMKMFMKFMGMFLSKKMMQRIVFLKETKEVGELLGNECIPKNFGKLEGSMEFDEVQKEYFS